MFPIHCNNCAKKRDDYSKLSFELTQCHHIICEDCVPKFSEGKHCPVCKRPLQSVAITHNMADNMAHYFMDPSRFIKMYRNVSHFQYKQRAYYYSYFERQQRLFNNKKQKLNGYIKIEEQLRQKIDDEKNKISKLQDYIAFYDRREESMLQNSSFSSNDISSTARRICRPRTPSFSTTITTVSDNDDNEGLNDNIFRKEPKQIKSRPSLKKLKTSDKNKDAVDLDFFSNCENL